MSHCTCIGAGLSAAAYASAQVRPVETTKNIVTIARDPLVGETPSALAAWLTPIPQFYVRNHFSAPEIRREEWALSVEGLVADRAELTLDEIKRFPRVTMPVTIECAGNNRSDLDPPTPGNQFNGGAVSTAYWAGARLADVISRANPLPGAREILFEGCDSGSPEPGMAKTPYLRSLPIDVAMRPDTLLVYEMNGEELPPEHGHPLRLIVPGWYGMASVKWLRRVSVIDAGFEGYFQTHKYVLDDGSGASEPVTSMGVKSLIGSPADGDTLRAGATVCVNGMAWSGGERIAKVEVSADGGETWQAAEMVGPSERYAWRRWHYAWTPETPGDRVLMSRASDAAGNSQPMRSRWNRYGYMVNGVRPVSVSVSPPADG